MDNHFFKHDFQTLEMVNCAISNQPTMVIASDGKQIKKSQCGKMYIGVFSPLYVNPRKITCE